MKPVKIFCTPGSEDIAERVFNELKSRLPDSIHPHALGKVEFTRFSNENIEVQILENVRGTFSVIIHTQVSPVAQHTVDLFALVDAISNSGAADRLLVFPYLPYSRSDRKNKPRISTMGQLFPEILWEVLNVRRFLLVDPHDGHLKHYFKPVADEVTSLFIFAKWIEEDFFLRHKREECVIVFADQGAAKNFKELAYLLKLPSAYIDKDRPDNLESVKVKKIIGNTEGKICIMIDDEILTGGTAINDALLLREEGKAKKVIMCAVHPILMCKKKSVEEIMRSIDSSPIEELVVTNSVPLFDKAKLSKKLKVVSIEALLAESISRIILDKSLSDLHEYKNIKFYT